MQTKLKQWQELVQKMIETSFSDVVEEVYATQQKLRQGKRVCEIALPKKAEETLRWSLAYSLLAGGKRIRPVLALAMYEACCRYKRSQEPDYSTIAPLVLAIEAVHTYSLVHDDLPAMDNDELRHGLPTAHVIWDEAKAILLGDALLTFAFESLTTLFTTAEFAPENILRTIRYLAAFAGKEGMVRGQWRDMNAEQAEDLPKAELLALIREKTACLLQAPLLMIAALFDLKQEACTQLSLFGENLGIAFQIKDDILDTVATTLTLGKTVGKDEESGKRTYVTMYGLAAAQEDLHMYTQQALQALLELKKQGFDVSFLQDLAKWLLERKK